MIAILWRLLLIKIGWADWRHRACLARIAVLEAMLYPKASWGPGVVWVEDAPLVQIFPSVFDTNLYRAGANHLVTSGLIRSALAQRGLMEQQAFYGVHE